MGPAAGPVTADLAVAVPVTAALVAADLGAAGFVTADLRAGSPATDGAALRAAARGHDALDRRDRREADPNMGR
ncbi:hypothetical protein GCM10011574_61580 [Microbispora bryophytorum]|uniref:Uncharacterized protein n=1 Tax=Microbispora bryophytorum TaxID=1460882 RepID=A0A8H9H892_9ACTN|nr:hypothetical protein GCM10011574_61580 [Microbispora bryophytorum]